MTVVLALGATWLTVVVLGAAVLGRAIRLADEREDYTVDEPLAVVIPLHRSAS